MKLIDLFVKEEDFSSHVNTLCIKLDRLPNPTKEEREVGQVPCTAKRMIARNVIGKMILKRRWKRGIGGPASFTHDGTVIEVCPLPVMR